MAARELGILCYCVPSLLLGFWSLHLLVNQLRCAVIFVLQGAFGKLFIKFNIMWCRYRKFSSLGNYPILEVSSSVCCVCDASPDFTFSQKVRHVDTYGLKVLRGYPSFYHMDHEHHHLKNFFLERS